jgi:adenosylcobinamide kinase/adenosylcobinamide-phosphate guanylyltransferase
MIGNRMREVGKKALILILGGVRGGKSAFAQTLAAEHGGSVTFVATAEARDEEMERRIEDHRRARPASWRTIEAPLNPAAALAEAPPAEVTVLDCLTLLVSNLLLRDESPEEAQQAVDGEVEALLRVFEAGSGSLIIVSNEVGMGVVPPYELGRLYRDLLGWANQRIAQSASEVYWMLAGLPIEVKASGLARNWKGYHVENQ